MNTFLMLLQLYPQILGSIVATEAAFGHAPGSVKKQIVLNSVGTAAKIAGKPASGQLTSLTGTLIDTTVASLNGQGLLNGHPTAPSPAK